MCREIFFIAFIMKLLHNQMDNLINNLINSLFLHKTGDHIIKWRADNTSKIYADGLLLGEQNNYINTVETELPYNTSVVAFELRNVGSGIGLLASYENGWTTNEVFYWRCTRDSGLITAEWKDESKS